MHLISCLGLVMLSYLSKSSFYMRWLLTIPIGRDKNKLIEAKIVVKREESLKTA